MRTLTQVWVFFVSLTVAFLFIGFQFYGRLGLFVSFLASLLLIYITLHKGLWFFRRHLEFKEILGSDPTGFLNSLNAVKRDYDINVIHLYTTNDAVPPLVWKDYPKTGFIILHEDLLKHLTEKEKHILVHFLFAHLKVRPTFRPRLFSIFEFGFLKLQFLLSPFMSLLALMFGSPRFLLKADLVALANSQVTQLEFGYFLKKLHDLNFHRAKNLNGAEYFSTLTAAQHTFWKSFGQPSLKRRLVSVMGFLP
ncbi:MAG: hypothetical protein H7256_11810 [Bdellovibrio sp.]|nr:hypothetical protein [Bdellovibrio sp.]